jgi:superfamily II DNA or RNA helicase
MHEQYHTRSNKYGIICETWSSRTSLSNPPINILVTIEMVQGTEFHEYVTTLAASSGIARIIVDEADLALRHDSFRPVMHTLRWLGQQGLQVFLQTATLPPSLEEELFHAFGISSYVVLRSKTNRPNISYNVVKTADVRSTLQAEFKTAMDFAATNRVLIFCLSKDDAETTAAQLGIRYCHAELSAEEINELLTQFRSGKIRAIASTSILGVALDVPGVSHVIHLDYPRDCLSFSQETGRVGRDSGTPKAWSIVIVPTISPMPRIHTNDRFGARLIRDSVDGTKICRRLMNQMFIDGVAESCSMMEGVAHMCDICELESRISPDRGSNAEFPSSLIDSYLKPSSG